MKIRNLGLGLALILSAILNTPAQQAAEMPGQKPGTILLTIFLRHHESKTLDEIQDHLSKSGFPAELSAERD